MLQNRRTTFKKEQVDSLVIDKNSKQLCFKSKSYSNSFCPTQFAKFKFQIPKNRKIFSGFKLSKSKQKTIKIKQNKNQMNFDCIRSKEEKNQFSSQNWKKLIQIQNKFNKSFSVNLPEATVSQQLKRLFTNSRINSSCDSLLKQKLSSSTLQKRSIENKCKQKYNQKSERSVRLTSKNWKKVLNLQNKQNLKLL